MILAGILLYLLVGLLLTASAIVHLRTELKFEVVFALILFIVFWPIFLGKNALDTIVAIWRSRH